MLERQSALSVNSFEGNGISISENADFVLTQVAGFGKAFEKTLSANIGTLPTKVGVASSNNGRTILRVGVEQFWIVGPEAKLPATILQTPLSSSRCRIELQGKNARHVLSRCAQLDFHESQFRTGHFAMTGIHHTPVLIHCIGENQFHLYALRTFARTVWEWVTDAAAGL